MAKQARVRQAATVLLATGHLLSIAIAPVQSAPVREANSAANRLYSDARSGDREGSVPYIDVESQWRTGSRPKRREDLGQRGIPVCPSEVPLTALVPESAGGLTAVARPEFFFYVPHEGATVIFSLFEMNGDGSKGEPVFQQTQVVARDRPLVRVKVPRDRQLLPERPYTWQLSAICNRDDRSDDIYVEGYIQRVQLRPEIAARLHQEGRDRRASLYTEHRLWFETLSTLLDPEFCRTEGPRARELLIDLLTAEDVRLNPEIAAAAIATCRLSAEEN